MEFRATKIALFSFKLFHKLFTVERVPVTHFNPCGVTVVLPVGNTVTNCETLKVRLENSRILGISDVVLVDVVSKVRYVDAGVRFTTQVEVIYAELGELGEESEDSGQVVLA